MLKKYIPVLLCTLAVTAGCKKEFLEVDPVGKTIAATVADYNNLFYNTSLLATSFSDIQIALSDEVAGINTYLSGAPVTSQRAFNWEKDVYTETEDAAEFTRLMTQVYIYNKIVNEVVSATNGTDSARLALRAEARASRAWSNFMLINYYAKPYNAATAASDPGFPVVTAADAAVTSFARASVKDFYDYIVKDLTESIPLLPVNNTVRTRMNKAGALILLGKVYVFMGRYTEALQQLQAAAGVFSNAIPASLYDYNITLASGGGWGYSPTANSYTGGPIPFNSAECIVARNFTSNYNMNSNYLVMTPTAMALYGPNDMRRRLFTRNASPASSNVVFPLGMTRMYGFATVISYGINMPEYYLLLAECKARTNDLTGAKADLETLRVKRMPATDAAVNVTGQNNMIRFVIEERQREFAMCGYRWFDIRRLSVDPLFTGNTYTHVLYDINGNVQSTATLSADRMTLRFPLKIMAQNPNIVNNP